MIMKFSSCAGGGIAQTVAWFSKICVAVYAFISGYAIQRRFEKYSGKEALYEEYKDIAVRLCKFIRKFWLVFIAFVPIGILINKYSEISLRSFITAFLGGNDELNTEWWYVKFYICIFIIIPLADVTYKEIQSKGKSKIAQLAANIVPGVLIAWYSVIVQVSPKYTLIFWIGYVVAKNKLYERVYDYSKRRTRRNLIAAAALLSTVTLRIMLVSSAGDKTIDILLVTPFIYGILILLKENKYVCSFLSWIGNYSIYMWLTHTFFIYYFFSEFSMASGVAIVMYIQLVVETVLIGIVLSRIDRWCDSLLGKLGKRCLEWDRLK